MTAFLFHLLMLFGTSNTRLLDFSDAGAQFALLTEVGCLELFIEIVQGALNS